MKNIEKIESFKLAYFDEKLSQWVEEVTKNCVPVAEGDNCLDCKVTHLTAYSLYGDSPAPPPPTDNTTTDPPPKDNTTSNSTDKNDDVENSGLALPLGVLVVLSMLI